MDVMILGSKEYPLGSGNSRDDPSPPGGMEVYVNDLVDHLRRYRSLDITVITRKFRLAPAVEHHDNLHVYRVPFIRGFYLRTPTFNALSFLKAMTTTTDVIITHGEIANLFGLVAARLRRKPVIMVCHGRACEQPHYNTVVRALFAAIDRLTYPHATITVTHSPDQLRQITDRYVVIYPGLHRMARSSPARAAQLKRRYHITNQKVIMFTGRLVGVKGVEFLLHALRAVSSPYVCLIVGDGPDRQRYQHLAEALGVRAVFTGFTSQISDLLSLADVFVLPSLSESLNYSVLEAAAVGVPLVVTDLGIVPAGAAVIVPKKDPAAIAQGINTLLADRKLARTLARRAALFAKKFRWDRAAQQYDDIIRQVAP